MERQRLKKFGGGGGGLTFCKELKRKKYGKKKRGAKINHTILFDNEKRLGAGFRVYAHLVISVK